MQDVLDVPELRENTCIKAKKKKKKKKSSCNEYVLRSMSKKQHNYKEHNFFRKHFLSNLRPAAL